MKVLPFFAALALSAVSFAQPTLRPDNIEEILKAMTLEEKALLCVGRVGGDDALLEGLGMADYSSEANQGEIVPGAGGMSQAIPRLGIPRTVFSDGPAGVHIARDRKDRQVYCTSFPVGVNLASSWDPELVEEVTCAMGNEFAEYGIDVALGPAFNIHRNPLCGRNFEYMSEDPVLAGKIAAAYVRDIQSNGVGATVKHFAANNQETLRLENDAVISQRALREIYLKNFEIAIKEARPWAVMSSYNKINGTYAQQSRGLLHTILREEWGFDGIVMTDWGEKTDTHLSIAAGNGIMQAGTTRQTKEIIDKVRSGELSEEALDESVRYILSYIVKTRRYNGVPYSDHPDMEAHAAVVRNAGAQTLVLLKNEGGTLPLSEPCKVAAFGVPSVDFASCGRGSGSVVRPYVVNVCEGLRNAGFDVFKPLEDIYTNYVGYHSAMSSLAYLDSIDWDVTFGKSIQEETGLGRDEIEKCERRNDLAVLTIARCCGEGWDRKDTDFELTGIERKLLTDVCEVFHASGKKVVVILNIGGPIETASWKDLPDAILLAWHPGQEGGNSVADVLTGKVCPSGKLPTTFPVHYMDVPSSRNFQYYGTWDLHESSRPAIERRDIDYTLYEEGIGIGYRYFETAGVEVSYPFGYGLSYTTFSYSEPSVKATKDGFKASVTVTNTGSVAGREVVQLYVSAPAGGLKKPARELKAFAKTRELQPGESQTLSFEVDAYSLASFNEKASRWETASGKYEVLFGASVADIRARGGFRQSRSRSWPVHDVLAPVRELKETF